MTRYTYPPEWRQMTPLERDNWHRHMGAVIRRARFLWLVWRLRVPGWKGKFWDGTKWREARPAEEAADDG